MSRPRLSLPGWVAVITATVAVVLVGIAFAIHPDEGLRIEAAATPSAAILTPEADDVPVNEPFSIDEIREHLLDRPTTGGISLEPSVMEVLLYCDTCVTHGPRIDIDGNVFQVALIEDPRTDTVFSAAVIGDNEDHPSLQLIVSGNDLSLTPGRGGTLVAQESHYSETDRACCPSGWSVQVYRFQNGRFEAGQRISSAGSG